MEFLKHQHKNIILVLVYTVIAAMIYIVWFNSMWHKIWINCLTGVIISCIGIVIGFFHIREIERKEKEEQIAKEEKTSQE